MHHPQTWRTQITTLCASSITSREILGVDSTLAVLQFAVLDPDRAQATEVARIIVGSLAALPAYRANLARMGFTNDDITQVTNLLIESVVACGDTDVMLERVASHHAAGADHVAIGLLSADPASVPMASYRRLATELAP